MPPKSYLRYLVPGLHRARFAGEGGTGTTSETAKVTLPGGVIVELPKADAEKILAAQTKANEEREGLARKVGAAEAERAAAALAAAKANEEKEALRLVKDGEITKAKEILSREANERLAKVGARLRDESLAAEIRRQAPNLDQSAVADMVALVKDRAAFDADTGTVAPLGADGKPATKDGKPLGLDSFLADWLSTRPHFQAARVPHASGGSADANGGAMGTIRRADLATMTRAQADAMTAGKLRVVD